MSFNPPITWRKKQQQQQAISISKISQKTEAEKTTCSWHSLMTRKRNTNRSTSHQRMERCQYQTRQTESRKSPMPSRTSKRWWIHDNAHWLPQFLFWSQCALTWCKCLWYKKKKKKKTKQIQCKMCFFDVKTLVFGGLFRVQESDI